MSPQFLARYPSGSLISELLNIHQGKFIVRVSAQVEGVTRATGMAAAETLELAEDRARSRALLVLGIDQIKAGEKRAEEAEGERVSDSSSYMVEAPDFTHGKTSKEFFPEIQSEAESINIHAPSALFVDPQSSGGEAPNKFGDVMPSLPLNYTPPEGTGSLPQTDTTAITPLDLSDAIARTSMEIKRLKWSNQQGREYLKQKYAKRSRQELTDEEMLEFLDYLESQPTPANEPFA